jgi:hypothetical protein
VHVVVEGELDAILMKRLLEDLTAVTITYYTANGKNAARPLARKIQLDTHQPVIFIADSDDPDPQRSHEQRRSYQSYFRMSSDGVPFHVALIVPSVEVLFLRNPELVSNVSGRGFDRDVEALARYAPKQALATLFGGQRPNLTEWVHRIDERDLRLLREESEVREIRQFLAEIEATFADRDQLVA